MKTWHLFAWGANSHGQLGLGYESEQSVLPEEVDVSETNIKPEKIRKIVGGAGHTLILDNTGRIYSCGWNKRGQAGTPQLEITSNLQLIDALKNVRIKDVACGWDSSMALTNRGEVYTWGSNSFGQLGRDVPGTREYTNVPGKVPSVSRIKRIAMGLRHSLLLTEEGRILVAGAGNKCQLGITDTNGSSVRQIGAFTLVPGIEDVDDISCGQYFSTAVTKSGEIYSWGCNKYGQLGCDFNEIKSRNIPTKLKERIGPIEMLKCGWTHTGVLTSDGRVYPWGRNTYGQLGDQNRTSHWTPQVIKNVESIEQLSIASEHNVALDCRGNILSWGWNEHGNCGNGNTDNVWIPQRISLSEEFKGVLIGSGAGHSFAVVEKIRN